MLLSGVGKGADINAALGMNPEESSLGIHNMAGEESSMSVGKMGVGSGLGIDDSELTNNMGNHPDSTNVINTKKNNGKPKDNKDKPKKDKSKKDKKKKKKKDSDSDSDDKEKPPA